MRRLQNRVRIAPRGEVEIVDPALEDAELLRAVSGAFVIQSADLEGFERPALKRAQAERRRRPPFDAPIDMLWALHDGDMPPRGEDRTISLIELKQMIAERLADPCVLCAKRCLARRNAGEIGECGLGKEAYAAEHFVHIGEEAPINPSLVINLRGCALRCRGCQQHRLLDTRAQPGESLTAELWSALELDEARSLSFVGGNPDESLPSILAFLAAAPDTFALPVVWNAHAYASPEVVRLLAGVVDCFLPDFKFFNEDCARAYTKVRHYPVHAQRALEAMAASDAAVIARILLMPGHVECCHIPTLAWLSTLPQERLLVSLRAQYAPDWRIKNDEGPLAGRVSAEEAARAESAAKMYGLTLIEAPPPAFLS